MTVPPETIAQWQASFEGTMIGLVGFSILSASKETVVAEVPFGPQSRQVTGLCHAGAILTLADTAATALANLHTQASADDFDPSCFPLTVQLGENFIRNTFTDRLVATAVPVHIGRRTLVVSNEVRDAEGRLFATVTNTLVPAGESGSTPPSEGERP